MYNVKEKEMGQLEIIEKNMLRKFFKTKQGCPIYQLDFEPGHCPARFQYNE